MGSEARARLGFGALLFIVLLSLEQVFATGEYAGPAVLAASIATLLMMVFRRFGTPVIASLAASVIALVWYVSVVFRASETFYLFPTPSAIRGVLNMISRAYGHSQIDYAPVPTRPGYVVLIVVGFWIMATVGEVSTFRWRRPLLAAIGPLALFGLILVVGTNAMGNLIVPFFLVGLLVFLGLESAHRLRTWGQWVAAWRDRRGAEPESLTGSVARRMGAACVLVALAAPLFLPSIGQGILAWRNQVGNGTFGNGRGGGFAGSASVDPLVSIKSQFLEQSDIELFRVTSEEPLYWRLVTLSEFDGLAWTQTEDPDFPAPNGAISSQLLFPPSPAQTDFVEQRFEMTGLSGRALPAAYQPGALEIAGDAADDLEFDPRTADLQLQTQIEPGLTYTVQSAVPETSYEILNTAQPGDLDGEYTDTAIVSPDVRDLLERWTRDAETPFQKLLAIQTQLRGFTYSTAVDNIATSDYLRQFLLETKAGYCQQFATAFTVMARLLGMEARVSVGFLPGETSTAEPNNYIVRGTDAHAWPEVYFEDLGWISFEPTPRGETAPPGYTIEGGEPSAGGVNLQSIGNEVQQPGRGRNASDLQDVRDPAGGAGGGNAAGPTRDRGPSRWETAFENLLRAVVVAAFVFLLAVPLLKEVRTRRRYARANGSRGRATAAFLDFEDVAAELASPRHGSESAVAYARRISRSHRVPRPPAMRLARIFEAAQYAPGEIPEQQVTEARRLARDLRRSLWSEATWWERASRLFSPIRLLGRTS
jgi:transglutaminase-like putative cysteine protease